LKEEGLPRATNFEEKKSVSRGKIVICTIAFLSSATAFAENAKPQANDAGPVASAKISLDAAVAVAEKHVQGKAVRAEYEKQKQGSWLYDVEVSTGSKVFDIKVDADKGTVIASTEDPADADDDGDKAD
jgi:uncharacterized membrane protein YkoI